MKPDLVKIAITDYRLFFCLVIIILIPLVLLLEHSLGILSSTLSHLDIKSNQPDDKLSFIEFLFIFYPVLLALCFVYSLFRLTSIYRLLVNGEEVLARVTTIPSKFISVGHLSYTYNYNGREYKSSQYILRYRAAVKAISIGDEIAVKFRKSNPSIAFAHNLLFS